MKLNISYPSKSRYIVISKEISNGVSKSNISKVSEIFHIISQKYRNIAKRLFSNAKELKVQLSCFNMCFTKLSNK